MIEYQNVYIILCCLIIYSCIKISFSGFVLLNLITLLYCLHEDQTVILANNSAIASAKASQEIGSKNKDENELKVTVNPRKNKELNDSYKNTNQTVINDVKTAKVDVQKLTVT